MNTDSSTETSQAPKASRWMRGLLIVSLGLNLLVVGVVGGWMFKRGTWGHHHPPRLEQLGGPLTRALSHRDRHEIGRRLRAEYRGRSEVRAAQMTTMEALISELRKQPFDREEVARLMASQRDTLNERLSVGQAVLLDRLQSMDPTERGAYATRLSESLARRRGD